jgi:hypothetical protein
MLKNCCISLLPNVLTSKDNYLKEESLIKILSSYMDNALNCITLPLGNLQIIPNSLTEITVEEYMVPILTKHTVIDIGNIAFPSSQRISSV